MIVNKTVWAWVGFLVVGLVALSALPPRGRAWAAAAVLLGALIIVQRRGGVSGIVKTFETMGGALPARKGV